MLDERKTAILRAVVREYIETAQPVGSNHVAHSADIRVSPATVRNEMSVLEQEGYLVQPHTSAGRIPTDKGYRFFVDHLAAPGRLDANRVQQVSDFFASSHRALEQTLAETSRLLAGLTNYAAVVLGPGADVATVRSIQVVGLSARVATVVVVLSSGAVEHEPIELSDDVTDARLSAAGAHLAHHLTGRSVAAISAPPATGDHVVDDLCRRAVSALTSDARRDDEHVYVGGAARMAAAFDAVDVVRKVLQTLEQQFVVSTLLRDVLGRGLSVAIGAEHGVEPLATCSVVVAPYTIDGEPVGTIGVLGPTRMNYPHALAAVEVVSEQLGVRLRDGES